MKQSSVSDLPTAVRLVHKATWRGMAWTEGMGVQWVQSKFLPAVRLLEQSSNPQDAFLAASGYFLLGDILQTESPREALATYHKCVSLNKNYYSAWFEIAEFAGCLGHRQLAKTAIRNLRRLQKAFNNTEFDTENVRDIVLEASLNNPDWDPISSPFSSRYDEDGVKWCCSEFLARFQPQRVLSHFKGQDGVLARQLRARAFGLIGDAASFLNEWKEIAALSEPFRLQSDWFYLPDAIWWEPDFWQILLDTEDRWQGQDTSVIHQSLYDAIPEVSPRFGKRDSARSLRRRILTLRCHEARASGNIRRLAAYVSRYPEWKEAARFLKRLRKNRAHHWNLTPEEKGLSRREDGTAYGYYCRDYSL